MFQDRGPNGGQPWGPSTLQWVYPDLSMGWSQGLDIPSDPSQAPGPSQQLTPVCQLFRGPAWSCSLTLLQDLSQGPALSDSCWSLGFQPSFVTHSEVGLYSMTHFRVGLS